MNNYICPECGFPLNGSESRCPECGITLQVVTNSSSPSHHAVATNTETASLNVGGCQCNWRPSPATDWGNYFYECWTIGWKAFTRMFRYSGRSARREFWSYFFFCSFLNIIPIIGGLIYLLGLLAVSVRRMHDINKSGWWIFVPFWSFFWYLKRSDDGPNDYGYPEPSRELLNN